SAGTGMQWRLEQYDSKAKTHSKFGEGQFVACNHTWVAGARADFKTCANAAAVPGRDSVMKLGLNLQGFYGDESARDAVPLPQHLQMMARVTHEDVRNRAHRHLADAHHRAPLPRVVGN